MKFLSNPVTCGLLLLAGLAAAPDTQPAVTLRVLTDRTQRGSLSDGREIVRGDSGRWNDRASLQLVPPITQRPRGLSLDDWGEQWTGKAVAATAADENWLIFRTRQLDDNDRVWVERIERLGNEFTVTMSEAIWKGNYFKTFTYYEVLAVNLGRLPPGEYTVKWVVTPLTFKQLAKPAPSGRESKDHWPLDEQPSDGKPVELRVGFSVK